MNKFREGIFQPTIGIGFGLDKYLSVTADQTNKLRKSSLAIHACLILQELLSSTTIEAANRPSETQTIQFTNSSGTLIRPPLDDFKKQLQWVVDLHDLREDRGAEILSQSGMLLPYLAQIIPIRPDRTPQTLLLIDALVQFCMFVHFRLKHDFSVPRPTDLSPQVQPIIPTPSHCSYPMGHATEAYAAATFMDYLLTAACEKKKDKIAILLELRTQLYGFAYRVGFNRLVAGVHFPIDLVAGAHLGRFLGIEFIKATYCINKKSQARIENFVSATKTIAHAKLSELPQIVQPIFKQTLNFEAHASLSNITPTVGAVASEEISRFFV